MEPKNSLSVAVDVPCGVVSAPVRLCGLGMLKMLSDELSVMTVGV